MLRILAKGHYYYFINSIIDYLNTTIVDVLILATNLVTVFMYVICISIGFVIRPFSVTTRIFKPRLASF